jgi:GTP-binding protein
MATPAKINSDKLPVVALVGRVNVGKSKLFNRLIEENKAMVSNTPGTTRTRNEGTMLWRGKYIKIVDTGGLTFTDKVLLEPEIIKQSEDAIKSCDIIIFVTDAKEGILPQEKELAKLIHRLPKKPIIFVANKTDSQTIENNLDDPSWSKPGLGQPFPISAANGRNIGDFLDLIYKQLSKIKKTPKTKITTEDIVNVTIIGKPNVGKSSLFNKLIGEDKVIVSPMPHTTREPHDTLVNYTYEEKGKKKVMKINFVDTAGIRRKTRVEGGLEGQGVIRSIEATEDAEIILFVVDASETISSQDRQLGGLLEKRVKSVLIILNKWDLAENNDDHSRNEVKKMLYSYFPHLDFAPILLISSLTGYRTHSIFPEIIRAHEARQTVIPEEDLRKFIKHTVKEHLPSRGKGIRHPEILGFRQLAINPPVFELYIKPKTSLNESYVHFIERRLREQYDFYATPIVIKLTKLKR